MRNASDVPLRRLAQPDGLFCDGDWIEAPYITDDGVRLIQTGNIGVGLYREQGFRFVSEDTFRLLNCTEVLPGDLLVCRLAEPVGRSCLAPDLGARMITSVDVAILRPSGSVADVRYLNYSLSSSRYLDLVDSIARGGTRQRISREQLGRIPVRVPPLQDQRAIADYLDAETARIDALIAKKRRMIDLLEERFGSYVVRTVLGDHDAMLTRPSWSGIYGLVPESWVETPLRHLNCDVQTGPFGSQLHAEEYIEDGWPVVNPMNLSGGVIVATRTMTISDAKRSALSRHILRKGDIVFGRRGEMGRAGLVGLKEAGWLCGTGSLRVRLSGSGLLASYLKLLLETPPARAYFELASIGSTMDNLNSEIVLDFPALVPSPQEQEAIVAAVAEMGHAAEGVRARLDKQLNLLAEHRQALITAAVTGQIDIPGVAA